MNDVQVSGATVVDVFVFWDFDEDTDEAFAIVDGPIKAGEAIRTPEWTVCLTKINSAWARLIALPVGTITSVAVPAGDLWGMIVGRNGSALVQREERRRLRDAHRQQQRMAQERASVLKQQKERECAEFRECLARQAREKKERERAEEDERRRQWSTLGTDWEKRWEQERKWRAQAEAERLFRIQQEREAQDRAQRAQVEQRKQEEMRRLREEGKRRKAQELRERHLALAQALKTSCPIKISRALVWMQYLTDLCRPQAGADAWARLELHLLRGKCEYMTMLYLTTNQDVSLSSRPQPPSSVVFIRRSWPIAIRVKLRGTEKTFQDSEGTTLHHWQSLLQRVVDLEEKIDPDRRLLDEAMKLARQLRAEHARLVSTSGVLSATGGSDGKRKRTSNSSETNASIRPQPSSTHPNHFKQQRQDDLAPEDAEARSGDAVLMSNFVGQVIDREQLGYGSDPHDASKGWGFFAREDGKFGSLPSFDDYGDEGEP